jgi:hypothetical protein
VSEERITVRMQLKDAAKFVADAKAAGHEIEVLGDKADRASKKAKPFSSELERINKITRAMRWPVAIAGIGLVGQALASAATGGFALGAALAPAVGLLGTLPALAVLAGQGMGVLALGLSGVKDALGGLNGEIDANKFASLSRPAQDFALTLDSLRPSIRGLQTDLQAGLFPGLTQGLQSATPALHALHDPLVDTAGVFGTMGANLGALVGSRGFLRDLAAQARFNNVQLTRLGGGGLHVVNMLRNLAVTARPVVSWMVRLVAGWAEAGDKAVALGRSTGGLQRMFHSVQVTMSRVGRIGADLAVTLFNIGRIGKRALGDELLVSLVRGSDALRRWTESGDGVQKITKFFTDAKPVIYATGRFLGEVATQLLRFGAGSDSGLVGILGTMTSMVKIVGGLSDLVGPDTIVYAFLIGKGLAGSIKAYQALTTTIYAARSAAIALGLAQAGAAAAAPGGGLIGGAAKGGLGRTVGKVLPRVLPAAGAIGVTGAAAYGIGALLNKLPHDKALENHRDANGDVTPHGRLIQQQHGDPNPLGAPIRRLTSPPVTSRAPRSAPVSRASAPPGQSDSLFDRLDLTVMPQAINLDGQPLAESTATVAVKHASRR